MSHIKVKIPKVLPLKGNWIYVVAENWIENGILYFPDDNYTVAYTHLMSGFSVIIYVVHFNLQAHMIKQESIYPHCIWTSFS